MKIVSVLGRQTFKVIRAFTSLSNCYRILKWHHRRKGYYDINIKHHETIVCPQLEIGIQIILYYHNVDSDCRQVALVTDRYQMFLLPKEFSTRTTTKLVNWFQFLVVFFPRVSATNDNNIQRSCRTHYIPYKTTLAYIYRIHKWPVCRWCGRVRLYFIILLHAPDIHEEKQSISNLFHSATRYYYPREYWQVVRICIWWYLYQPLQFQSSCCCCGVCVRIIFKRGSAWLRHQLAIFILSQLWIRWANNIITQLDQFLGLHNYT